MKQLQLLGLILLMAMSSCLNDIDDVTSTQQTPNPDIIDDYVAAVRNISGSVTGFVVDENNDPVPGAAVKMGSLNTTADDYGHFFFNDVTMNALGQLVQIDVSGYFDASRRFFPMEGEMSRVKIQLIPKVFDASFTSGTGGIVNVTSGGFLEFEANSIKDSNGDPYSGEVRLATQWLDPSSLSTFDRMPGNLQGVNTQNTEMALATYGMMAVELESPTGESLNLLDGETAKITMPVPVGMRASAPLEIPLWSYSEIHGVWVEEGVATLVGDAYVGEVSHFSFWNCDIPLENVFFETQITDTSGAPLANYMVTIVSSTSGTGYGWTDMDGNVSGIIPANQVLTLNVYGICGDLLHSEDVGPFAADATYGPVAVSGGNVLTTVISGQLVDCDLNPLLNGLVVTSFDGFNTYTYLDGSTFEIEITTCQSTSEITVFGIDLDNQIQSASYTALANQTTDLGDLEVCDNPLTDYILITIGSNTALYVEATVDSSGSTGGGDYTYIQSNTNGNPNGTENFIGLGFEGVAAGDYSASNFIEIIYNSEFNWQFQGGSFENFVVSEYDSSPGGHITGSFSGDLESGGTTYATTGSFDITR